MYLVKNSVETPSDVKTIWLKTSEHSMAAQNFPAAESRAVISIEVTNSVKVGEIQNSSLAAALFGDKR